MTQVGFDERLAMAAQRLLRTRTVPFAWPARAAGDAVMQQPLQPSAYLLENLSTACF